MTRSQLEHIIRSAAAITNDPDVVVMGSQAVLGQFPGAPAELLLSMEAYIYPRRNPELSELVDRSIGEGSPFRNTYGYFAHGVGPETAAQPSGWDERLVRIENANTSGARGWCLEVHDLAIAKHVAGREKDVDYTAALVRYGMVERDVLLTRLSATPISAENSRDRAGSN